MFYTENDRKEEWIYMPQTIHTLLIQYLSEIQKIYGAHVTYSRHLNLTDCEDKRIGACPDKVYFYGKYKKYLIQ